MYGENQIAPLSILIRTIQHVAKLSRITTTSTNSSTDENHYVAFKPVYAGIEFFRSIEVANCHDF